MEKWAKDLNRHFSKEDIKISGQRAHEKMLNITDYQKNANQKYYEIPVTMTIITKSTNNKCYKGCGEEGTLLHYKLVQLLWKTVWRCLRKVNIELPYDPAIPLLGIFPDKTFIEKQTNHYVADAQ